MLASLKRWKCSRTNVLACLHSLDRDLSLTKTFLELIKGQKDTPSCSIHVAFFVHECTEEVLSIYRGGSYSPSFIILLVDPLAYNETRSSLTSCKHDLVSLEKNSPVYSYHICLYLSAQYISALCQRRRYGGSILLWRRLINGMWKWPRLPKMSLLREIYLCVGALLRFFGFFPSLLSKRKPRPKETYVFWIVRSRRSTADERIWHTWKHFPYVLSSLSISLSLEVRCNWQVGKGKKFLLLAALFPTFDNRKSIEKKLIFSWFWFVWLFPKSRKEQNLYSRYGE